MTESLATPVWFSTGWRWNPLQTYAKGVLTLDGGALTFQSDEGATIVTPLSEAEIRFPLSMLGGGFVVSVRGSKLYIWFYDPAASRTAALNGDDPNQTGLEAAVGLFSGRKAAKPWRKTLRA